MFRKTSQQGKDQQRKSLLTGASVLAATAATLVGTPAFAQQQQQQSSAATAAVQEDEEEAIVVTGTLIRGNVNSVSPLTVIDDEELDARGVATVQDAIQSLSVSGGPSVTNSFAANGAFAGGASGISLRGLTVNSTLVLFDGLRASYYPLADDGTRNFVDLNTIPDDIVERVEVLRDGASALYGADAIAGVVNLVTRREFQGATARLEAGMSSRGDAQQDRLSVTLGAGDLREDGINAYVSAFRYDSAQLYNRDRPYPFNSLDLSGVCYQGNCGLNGNPNAVDNPTFGLSTAANFLIRPYIENPDGTLTAVAARRWENAGACTGNGDLNALTVAQQGTTNPAEVCTYDYAGDYYVINPEINRWGVSGRATAILGNDAEVYVEANFMESAVSYTGTPAVWYGNANTGVFYPRFSSAQQAGAVGFSPETALLSLPVWVCSAGSAAYRCDGSEADAVLNPNNPYAAEGYVARLIGRNHDEVTETATLNRTYRVAGGLSGEFANGWAYDVGAVVMHTDLLRTSDGYNWIEHMLDVINDGTYNFASPGTDVALPWAPSAEAVNDYVTPPRRAEATSDQAQLQASITIPVWEMAGGTAQLALGGSVRYEAVDAPSGNTDFYGATQRYMTLNAFGTEGSRRANAAFFEFNAPILPNLDVNLAGRYDDYSSGQSAFSPKIGARWRVIDPLTLRASYSEGFRIPSFAEANALPTTGFVSNNVSLFNDTYLAQYGCSTATFATCPTYIRSGSYGQTTLASPNLDPEESTSLTLGFILQPFSGFSLSVDYYEIEKTDVITQPSNAPAIQAYYNGDPIPAGYTVIPDAVDPAFPLAQPRIAFVQSQLINADIYRAQGWDFQVMYRHEFDNGISLNSSFDASYLDRLETEFPDGTVERYDGTLGNFNLTSGNGTQKWRGTWRTTVGIGMFDLTGTINYVDGYNLSAMDQGTGYDDCGLSDGTTPCDVDSYLTFDLGARANLNENVTLYLNVLNVADEMPPVDIITYGATHYNAVQGGNGILGRYFRAGVRLTF